MSDTHVLDRRIHGRKPVVLAHPVPVTSRPSYKAYRLLQAGFVATTLLAGADKFFHLITDWNMYLATPVEKMLGASAPTFMLIAGGIEIAAGLLVAVLPRIGAFVVSAWLLGITVNLLLPPGYYDIALRDFGLALAACSLGLLAKEYGRPLWKAYQPG